MPAARPAPRGGRKPRDAGTGVVCASLTSRGWWLSMATIDAAHGFVELTGMPPFDERSRGDPDAVRRYRALMADPSSAFLRLEPTGAAVIEARLLRRAADAQLLEQRLTLRRATGGRRPAGAALRFSGRLDLPPLAMITESRAWPAPQLRRTRLAAEGAVLEIAADGLETVMTIEIEGAPARAGWQLTADGGAVLELRLPAGRDELRAIVRCRIDGAGRDVPARRGVRSGAVRPAPANESLWLPAELRPMLDRVRRRALRYVRECTALRVAADRVVLLTDHRLLPLSWTRDAYYQAALLLTAGDDELVADHLRWLWLDCDRPALTWARSHHADGRRHDEVYQADQQLYPLLELAEYRRRTGRLPTLGGDGLDEERSWPALVGAVLDDLGRRLQDGLLPTDENAADDPVGLPFLLANQLLAWHTFERLAEWPELEGSQAPPAALARTVRSAVERHFGGGAPGAPWPYAVDGRGGHILYHDANDVPTALAPLFGLCRPDDRRWRQTMEFALSPANEAWVVGPFGGLGSRHTPGVWSLGLIQEWVARSLTGERDAAESALRRLIACSLSDGMLPEASDPSSAEATARHWFAWPAALLGALLPAEPPGRSRSAGGRGHQL